MNKRNRRIVCFVLVVSLVFGLGINVFAAGGKEYCEYEHYVSLGDSIAAGWGPYSDAAAGSGWITVEGTYPAIVKDTLGAELDQLAWNGMRTSDLLYILDPEYTPKDWTLARVTLDYDRDFLHDKYVEAIRNADIITMEIGCNDVFTTSMLATVAALADIPLDNNFILRADEFLFSPGAMEDAMTNIFGSLFDLQLLENTAADLIRNLESSYQEYLRNWDAIVEIILDLNPTVTLLGAGLYNPVKNLTLAGEDTVKIGEILNVITTACNAHILQHSLANGYYYVDVTGTNSLVSCSVTDALQMYNVMMINVHPSLDGHAYMAKQFLSVLPERSSLACPNVEAFIDERGNIQLCWDKVDGAARYNVYRAGDDGEYHLIFTTKQTTYTDDAKNTDSVFSYRIAAMPKGLRQTPAYSRPVAVTMPDCSHPGLISYLFSQSRVSKIFPATEHRYFAGKCLICGKPSPTAEFVTNMYRAILGREPDPSGLGYWSEKLETRVMTGVEMLYSFFTSDEFLSKDEGIAGFIERLYSAVFDRAPDVTILGKWINAIRGGFAPKRLLTEFAASEEFKNACHEAGIEPGTVSDLEGKSDIPLADAEFSVSDAPEAIREFVTRLYRNCLRREPDEEGLLYWCRQLTEKRLSGRDIVAGFFASPEFKAAAVSATEFLQRAYNACMDRDPDPTGLTYWLNKLTGGSTLKAVTDGITESTEFRRICSAFGILFN